MKNIKSSKLFFSVFFSIFLILNSCSDNELIDNPSKPIEVYSQFFKTLDEKESQFFKQRWNKYDKIFVYDNDDKIFINSFSLYESSTEIETLALFREDINTNEKYFEQNKKYISVLIHGENNLNYEELKNYPINSFQNYAVQSKNNSTEHLNNFVLFSDNPITFKGTKDDYHFSSSFDFHSEYSILQFTVSKPDFYKTKMGNPIKAIFNFGNYQKYNLELKNFSEDWFKNDFILNVPIAKGRYQTLNLELICSNNDTLFTDSFILDNKEIDELNIIGRELFSLRTSNWQEYEEGGEEGGTEEGEEEGGTEEGEEESGTEEGEEEGETEEGEEEGEEKIIYKDWLIKANISDLQNKRFVVEEISSLIKSTWNENDRLLIYNSGVNGLAKKFICEPKIENISKSNEAYFRLTSDDAEKMLEIDNEYIAIVISGDYFTQSGIDNLLSNYPNQPYKFDIQQSGNDNLNHLRYSFLKFKETLNYKLDQNKENECLIEINGFFDYTLLSITFTKPESYFSNYGNPKEVIIESKSNNFKQKINITNLSPNWNNGQFTIHIPVETGFYNDFNYKILTDNGNEFIAHESFTGIQLLPNQRINKTINKWNEEIIEKYYLKDLIDNPSLIVNLKSENLYILDGDNLNNSDATPLIEMFSYEMQEAFNMRIKDLKLHLPFLKSLPNGKGLSDFYLGCLSHIPSLISVDAPLLEEIGAYAFADCPNLKNVNMPKLKSVGKESFARCVGITELSLPSLTVLGEMSFSEMSNLKNVNFSNDLTTIRLRSFRKCTSLEKINFPNVSIVEDSAFNGCVSIKEIILPKVVKIYDFAFDNSSLFEYIELGTQTDKSEQPQIGRSLFKKGISNTTLKLGEIFQKGENFYKPLGGMFSIDGNKWIINTTVYEFGKIILD